ncbi:MAG TPA: hypothetical protein VFA55_07950, partial [Candidatus Kapabacteria bacterium]|nr:hypothetical protein [Candidatus Kapabacteria bacterium]
MAAMLLALWGCATQHEGTKAVMKLPQAVHTDTALAMEYFTNGALHDIHDEYADAILDYQEALQYDDQPTIYYCIAKDYYSLRKVDRTAQFADRAAQYADSAIARDSTNTLYRSLRAEIALTLQGDFAVAQNQYERIIELDSDDVQALSDLAGLYQLRGWNKEAIHLY